MKRKSPGRKEPEGHLEIVRALVETGAAVNARDRWGTPLSRALGEGRLDVADYLRSKGAAS